MYKNVYVPGFLPTSMRKVVAYLSFYWSARNELAMAFTMGYFICKSYCIFCFQQINLTIEEVMIKVRFLEIKIIKNEYNKNLSNRKI